MSTTIAEPAPLTKLDIVAMRKADRVSFRHRDGVGFVCLCREERKKDGDPFGRVSGGDYQFAVDSYVTAYDIRSETWGRDATAIAQCFEHHGTVGPEYSCWPGICALVREGDELRLKWIADGSNQYMRQAAQQLNNVVHYDELQVQIRRKNRAMATFTVATGHCVDNSARMIRGC